MKKKQEDIYVSGFDAGLRKTMNKKRFAAFAFGIVRAFLGKPSFEKKSEKRKRKIEEKIFPVILNILTINNPDRSNAAHYVAGYFSDKIATHINSAIDMKSGRDGVSAPLDRYLSPNHFPTVTIQRKHDDDTTTLDVVMNNVSSDAITSALKNMVKDEYEDLDKTITSFLEVDVNNIARMGNHKEITPMREAYIPIVKEEIKGVVFGVINGHQDIFGSDFKDVMTKHMLESAHKRAEEVLADHILSTQREDLLPAYNDFSEKLKSKKMAENHLSRLEKQLIEKIHAPIQYNAEFQKKNDDR